MGAARESGAREIPAFQRIGNKNWMFARDAGSADAAAAVHPSLYRFVGRPFGI